MQVFGGNEEKPDGVDDTAESDVAVNRKQRLELLNLEKYAKDIFQEYCAALLQNTTGNERTTSQVDVHR